MTKVEMQLDSNVETIKYKPTILKNVIVYVAFIIKKCIITFIYLCIGDQENKGRKLYLRG